MECSRISTELAAAMAIAPPDSRPRRSPWLPTGTAQGRAAFGRAGDGFGLPALLGAHAGMGACGIDEGSGHRRVELFGHVHPGAPPCGSH